MAIDILTFALDGEVSLENFAVAIDNFNSLINQLSREVNREEKVEWIIEDLQSGSAIATFRGISSDLHNVENVIHAYEEVGDAITSGRELPFSALVKKHTSALTKILDGKILGVRFETPDKDYYISNRIVNQKSNEILYSFGSVQGTIETLTKHIKLSFTLWDSLFDRPIHCYVKEGEEENMRFAWGKRAVVAGKIGRNEVTGKPIVIRDVKYVRVVDEPKPGSYLNSKGVLSWGVTDESPEDMVRRLRDA